MLLIPVILSGGAGTRLWPVSREGHPKPFMKLADGQSLLLKTYLRAASVATAGDILTVTNRDYFFTSKDEFARARLGENLRPRFLLEPAGRNTAPAIAMAALSVAANHGQGACLLVLPADHLIHNLENFNAAVANAKALAADGKLVTFGIVPDAPEIGFGYIEAGEPLACGREVKRFVEKPDLEKAREYLAAGNFYWNSGMFCFTAGAFLEELGTHAPAVLEAAEACWARMGTGEHGCNLQEIAAELYSESPDISIDYAVMEHSHNVAVVPANFDWSDIGSWDAVRNLVEPDENGNRATGDTIFIASHNNFVQSESRLIAAVGIDHLMVIDTPDALLVTTTEKAQEVKQVVAQLKQRGHDAYKQHRTVTRHWGTYTVLEEGAGFKIKRIEVKPGASLSLQMHHHRSEHWIVVSGTARVVNGERELLVNINESTYIPAGHKHRLENPGVLDLVLIEVQSGEYLGEDDIVRFQEYHER